MNKNEEKDKKRKWLIIILLLALIVCIGVTIWALFFREPAVVLTPDYAPQETEENAKAIPDDDGTKLEAAEGGGAISIEYTSSVTIDLSDKKAILQYANPGKSTQDVVVQIVIQDEIIVQSGTIKPGNQVKELALIDGAEKKLQEGVYTNAKLVILSYDPVTGEKAMVNTEGAITVTVQS